MLYRVYLDIYNLLYITFVIALYFSILGTSFTVDGMIHSPMASLLYSHTGWIESIWLLISLELSDGGFPLTIVIETVFGFLIQFV